MLGLLKQKQNFTREGLSRRGAYSHSALCPVFTMSGKITQKLSSLHNHLK